MTQENAIFTVSQLNRTVRSLLESDMGRVWLEGEISNFVAVSSGHWYFSLKDSHSQIKCAMFAGKNRAVSFHPANGNQVLIRAQVSLYEPRGDFQLQVQTMQLAGDGLLTLQFEALKNRLNAEGLFADYHKKPLPPHPKRVGIVTSSSGAALHDILKILKRRDPSLPIVIYPTQVQGKDASALIAQSIALANARGECDVLILGRGGGSREDLWCFNEEIVARAISASAIPIISAVGHETDVSISDLVADIRASTPSAAAELISQDTSYKTQQLALKYSLLKNSMASILSDEKAKFTKLENRLSLCHPKAKLLQQAQRFDELERRLNQAMNNKLQQSLHQIKLKMETLNAVSPLATLSRGYSISQDKNNKVLRSVKHIKEAELLITVLPDGKVHSVVQKTVAQKIEG